MSFLTPEIMSGANWRALERAVARLLGHCGWDDVVVVGETNDGGADVVGNRPGRDGQLETYVVQVKAVTGANFVGVTAVQEALAAMHSYAAKHAIVATNGSFTDSAVRRAEALRQDGFSVRLWNGRTLEELLGRWPEEHHARRLPRPYQDKAIVSVIEEFSRGKKSAYFTFATGLGKSFVASRITALMAERGLRRSLVLCHLRELALQLERSFWPQLDKRIPTRVFFEGTPPLPCDGVNFGLFQTLGNTLSSIDPDAFDLVIVDEAHHAPASGFRVILSSLKPKFLLGMTATPVRDDGLCLEDVFGLAAARVSLLEGMNLGYLAQVDYLVYCDNIDWHEVKRLTRGKMSIRDLNRRLFIPQRDDAILGEVIALARKVANPRIIVFCSSIEHGERFAGLLSANGVPCAALSGQNRAERYNRLMRFSRGTLAAVTAVDVLNEGIDVPEVNIVVFLRCTHSRRIFLQQLGRGLRISETKDRVHVMDFVADIRRLADLAELKREVGRPSWEKKDLHLRGSKVTFTNQRALPFIQEWLKEIEDLAEKDDDARINFPVFELQ